MRVLSAVVGDPVRTPRGLGVVVAIAGAPGAELVTVRFENHSAVDFAGPEISAVDPEWNGGDKSSIDAFLDSQNEKALAAVEAFLDSADAVAVKPPPTGGRTHAATTNWCDCTCGRAGGCMRLSTAPDMHQPQAGSCRCEGKCPCA